MSNDNNDTPDNDNISTEGAQIIDFTKLRETRATPAPAPKEPKINSGTFEFHLLSPDGNSETVVAEGYMKFGPQFLAVVEGPEDDSMVLFATATHLVRYIRKVGDTGETQGTLSL